ncbi:MAG: DUF523 and DUF1722 domain-containing protein [Dictyoglomus sp.]|uniref:YbgA family protein n=1 Tax=Dictyoglomus TaxID=13 RepID=UPI002356DC2C
MLFTNDIDIISNMRNFTKPRIVYSACLNLEPVRYDGGIIKDSFALKLKEYCEIITVCPEVSIGLGVPREKIIVYVEENRLGIYQPKTGLDLTDKILDFSENFLNTLPEIDGFLLKSKSPSCGLSNTMIYKDREGKIFHSKGKGIFAQKVLEKFPYIPAEDEGRLRNPEIRERFLTRIFALSELRNLKNKDNTKVKDLIEFHQNNKYLLMVYSQKHLKELGNLLANQSKYPFEELIEKYALLFKEALSTNLKRGNHVNAIFHIYGYFSRKLKAGEKNHFLHLLDLYRRAKINLSPLVEILRSWAYRFDDQYLLNQTYLNPYPNELSYIE